jgi:catechol 2,3-dioxygenase-like lactoylglutathione lyase family enzyme
MTELRSFDHVALWTDERPALAGFLLDRTGAHEIERTDDFTLIGADARRGKLTLFDAEGPRDPGVLERVVLRVNDLEAASRRLGDAVVDLERPRDGLVTFTAPGGLGMGFVENPDDLDYDLDHVVLRVPDPASSAEGLAQLGFDRRNGVAAVADKVVRFEGGGREEGERPLLNHLAVLVDSATAVQEEAEQNGWEIDDVKDAANTLAVFVRGPDGIRVEYVEHKPGFALK